MADEGRLKALIDAADRRLTDYMTAHQREEDRFAETVTARFDGHNRFIEAAERREALFQAQVSKYIEREYYEVAHRELERRLGAVENLKANLEGRLTTIGGLIALASVGVQLLLYFIHR